MLAWTAAGAVARPRTLQLRLAAAHAERVAARAPVPSRAMTAAEAVANLEWFTTPGPRGLPVEALVLSGSGVAARADLPDLVARARRAGIGRIVLHAGAEDLRAGIPVDRCVLTVRLGEGGSDPARLRAALAARPGVDTNLPLVAPALPHLAEAAALAVAEGAASLTFTAPFPGGAEPPPPLAATLAALTAAWSRLRGTPATIKGLPACWLGALSRFTRRSANRWYVDAEHQKEAALLFFPGVVAFAKADACRFCSRDADCDGLLPGWSPPDAPAVAALE